MSSELISILSEALAPTTLYRYKCDRLNLIDLSNNVHVGTNNLNLFYRKEKRCENIRHCDRMLY